MLLAIDLYEKPISAAEPCGEQLDYDLAFLELEMAARGQPAQELGAHVIAAVPPNWPEVQRLAGELGARSKDLRVAILAARAALQLDGLGGLARGFEGLAVFVERYWANLHPRPDEEDGDDQMVRVNALANLCDPDGLLDELRRAPLTQSRLFGNFCLLQWLDAQRAAAGGEAPATPDVATIENGFRDTAIDILTARQSELDALLAAAGRIDKAGRDQPGVGPALNLGPLLDMLRQMKQLVDEHTPAAAVPAAPEAAGAAPALSAEIRDRNDVVGMLDRICRWYRANEPASPVPAMLERVKKVVSKDFMALLMELAPAGAPQFRALAGLTEGDPH